MEWFLRNEEWIAYSVIILIGIAFILFHYLIFRKTLKQQIMTAEKYLKYPVKYDSLGVCIWDAEKKMVCDVRGFGKIQYLFKNKDGTLDMDKAAKFQDSIGEFITEAINMRLLQYDSRKYNQQ